MNEKVPQNVLVYGSNPVDWHAHKNGGARVYGNAEYGKHIAYIAEYAETLQPKTKNPRKQKEVV